jgi:hypothetical protein
MSAPRQLGEDEKKTLLAAREAVWRAWFGGDGAQLTKLLPPELITVESSRRLRHAEVEPRRLARLRLVGRQAGASRLPAYRDAALRQHRVLYTTYEMDLVSGGSTNTQRGVATEIFVQQPDGRWVNTGWQLAPLR